MNATLKQFSLSLVAIASIFVIAAATKQLIGPSAPTTDRAIVRWLGTNAYSTTNSGVTIDDFNNVSGISTQNMQVLNIASSAITPSLSAGTAYVTNGFIYLQKASAPVAATIGGTVGSVTNHYISNVGGIFYDYWSDGTTVWNKQLAP